MAVAPHLELGRRGDGLAREGGGRLLAAALPRAVRAVDVVEAADAALHAEVLVVVHQQLLRHQLLEAVRVLRLRGPRVVLLEAARALEVLLELLVLGVDARRRGVPEALAAGGARGLADVERDHRRVVQMREWFDWMKPMPPMSAARLKHQSQPSTASLQFSYARRSRFLNSLQNMPSFMYSFSFQSTARIQWPSSLRRFARCDAMKPPAPVTQILSLGKSLVNFFSETGGSTILQSKGRGRRRGRRARRQWGGG